MTMTMTPQKGSSEKILAENDQPSGGASDVMVVSVGPGNYVVQAEMPDATGPLQFNMSLVGDVNGDHKVTAQDMQLMRSLKGVSAGQPGYSLAADPTADGTINAKDMSLARMNLGAAMTVQPLTLTAGLDPSSEPGREWRGDEPERDDLRPDGTGRDGPARPGGHGHVHADHHGRRSGELPVPGVRRDRRDAVPRRGRRRRPAGDGQRRKSPAAT